MRRVSEEFFYFSSLLECQWQYAVRPGNKCSGLVRFSDWPSSGLVSAMSSSRR